MIYALTPSSEAAAQMQLAGELLRMVAALADAERLPALAGTAKQLALRLTHRMVRGAEALVDMDAEELARRALPRIGAPL